MQLEPENMLVLALWIVLLVLVLLFIYQTFRKNRRAHVLTIALIFGIIGLTLWAFRPFLPDFLKSNTSVLANGFAYIFMYYALYLHFEQVSRLRPQLIRLAIMSAFVGMGLITTAVIITQETSITQLTMANDFAHDAIRMSAFLFGASVSIKSWMMTHEREEMVETSALLVLAVGGIPPILGNFFSLKSIADLSVYEIGDLVTFIGLVMLIGVYLGNPNYLYRLPTPLFRIIIFNTTGIAVYSRAIQTRGLEKVVVSDQLMSMSISAISSVLSESLQTNAQLRRIDITQRALLFEWREDLTALLICERATYFARRSLQMVLDSIPEPLFLELKSDAVRVDPEIVNTLDTLVRASFPYLVFIDEPAQEKHPVIEASDVDEDEDAAVAETSGDN
ncbi:MAG: hypothetical protein ACTSYL_03595 [Candidatus Thorarchaeota archaeon]